VNVSTVAAVVKAIERKKCLKDLFFFFLMYDFICAVCKNKLSSKPRGVGGNRL